MQEYKTFLKIAKLFNNFRIVITERIILISSYKVVYKIEFVSKLMQHKTEFQIRIGISQFHGSM